MKVINHEVRYMVLRVTVYKNIGHNYVSGHFRKNKLNGCETTAI